MMLATTALIMPITPAAVTVGKPHWTAEVKTQCASKLRNSFVWTEIILIIMLFLVSTVPRVTVRISDFFSMYLFIWYDDFQCSKAVLNKAGCREIDSHFHYQQVGSALFTGRLKKENFSWFNSATRQDREERAHHSCFSYSALAPHLF